MYHLLLIHRQKLRSASLGLLLAVGQGLWGANEALAQSISPSAEGTNTVVIQTQQHFDISGGSLSDKGDNLFHSFERFHLSEGESANFSAAEAIENIFAQIDGGQSSLIDGLLQVSGSSANLFFINPAGIIFGANATLNLPAALTVTTADALSFENGWLTVTGENPYATLSGAPQSFVFSQPESSGIVNEATLSFLAGESLMLLGGSVFNTGNLIAPGGSITMVALPDERMLRIGREGQLLSLEVSQQSLAELNNQSTSMSTSLSTLISRAAEQDASRLTINEDGTARLTNNDVLSLPIQPGTALSTGEIDVSYSSPTDSEITSAAWQQGGQVAILGNRVAVIEADITASGTSGGGRVFIGGDHQGGNQYPAAAQTFIGPEVTITANAERAGDGGQVNIWAEESTQYFGEVVARGGRLGGQGGMVEVSGKRSLGFWGNVDVSAPRGSWGSLLLDPTNIRIVDGDSGNNDAQVLDGEIFSGEGDTRFILSETVLEALSGSANIELQATNNIVIEDLSDDVLSFASGEGSITLRADADQDGSGNLTMNDTDDTISAAGRSLDFSGDTLRLGSIETTAAQTSGSITLTAGDTLSVRNLDSYSDTGKGGNITLSAEGDITTRTLNTEGESRSGNISITSESGDISVGSLLTESDSGMRGQVSLNTPANITIEKITTSGLSINDNEINETDRNIRHHSSTDLPRMRRTSRHRRDFLPMHHRTVVGSANASTAVAATETQRVAEFSTYFGRQLEAKAITPTEIQQMLSQVHSQIKNNSAVVYVRAPADSHSIDENYDDKKNSLGLLIFTAESEPIEIIVPGVDYDTLFQTIGEFRGALLSSVRHGSDSYLSSAQRLHQWLIAPLEAELGENEIDTLLFSMDAGLRSLPVAALHDGEQFLVEKYSLGMVPSLGLMNTDYKSLQDAQVLAMGVSRFKQLQPLPAVPAELSTIRDLWPAKSFLNETFSFDNLLKQQSEQPAQIIHLATHAEFNPGSANNSYIQLWDEQLRVGDLHVLGWDYPTVDLLVLSACRTALGNPEAEMGFAGLAVAAGVRSALASLWSVSDVGTLTLMGEFYDQLHNTKVKSEALRAAQLAMLRKETRFEAGQLLSDRTPSNLSLPTDLQNTDSIDLSHPYYWSGFTMVGSPW